MNERSILAATKRIKKSEPLQAEVTSPEPERVPRQRTFLLHPTAVALVLQRAPLFGALPAFRLQGLLGHLGRFRGLCRETLSEALLQAE